MKWASSRELATGHDYRSYSTSIKQALICGLMDGGVEVVDIGLALSPMAYFAQFALDCPAVAMVTASHNDNGWTGVKMGAQRPVTFGPEEMGRLRDIVLEGRFQSRSGGSYVYVENFGQHAISTICQPHQADAENQGRCGLRQWHGGSLRAGVAGAARLRGDPARRDAGLHLSAL